MSFSQKTLNIKTMDLDDALNQRHQLRNMRRLLREAMVSVAEYQEGRQPIERAFLQIGGTKAGDKFAAELPGLHERASDKSLNFYTALDDLLTEELESADKAVEHCKNEIKHYIEPY